MASTVDSTRVREHSEENEPLFEQKLDRLAKMVSSYPSSHINCVCSSSFNFIR